MTDLDDIWNEPVAAEPQRRRSPEADDDVDNIRSGKRRRATQPLFLDSDEDRDEGPSRGRLTQPKAAPEISDVDHLFDGLDDDDDELFKTQTLGTGPSVDQMRKDAEARAAARSRMRASSPMAPHAVASSSPPRPDPRAKESGDGKDKPRKKAMQLNASRLLGPDGFPALIQQTKGFKPKGKGHEQEDLNRLLQTYQFWAHRLYPKTTFRDTVKTVEKLCHTSQMRVAMSVWRDEAKGITKYSAVDKDLQEEADEDELPRDVPIASSRETSPTPGTSRSISRPESAPPTSASEFEEDFDMDAAIADQEEMERKQNVAKDKQPMDMEGEMDDDTFWGDLAKETSAQTAAVLSRKDPPAVTAATSTPMDDEWAELDDIMDERGTAPSNHKQLTPTQAKSPSKDHEEDWDELYM